MAYHCVELGHTRPVVGALYVRWLRWTAEHDRCRLRSFNSVTGMATLTRDGHTLFVRLSELSHWHALKE